VNLTNDGWFGEGAAQWQQAAAAIFRAVENGVPLVRSTNNGLTCRVDANGRLREIFKDKTGSEYGVGAMTVEIPLRQPGEKRAPTFYNQHGDWFGGYASASRAFCWSQQFQGNAAENNLERAQLGHCPERNKTGARCAKHSRSDRTAR